MTDLLGICTAWGDGRCVIVPESGDPVSIALADIVSGKPVPPRPSVRHRVSPLEAQTRAAMDGIKKTLEASGASFKDVVHYFVFRARPRMGDIGKASAVINSYFAPYGHKPTSTNMAVLELGEPEQLIEIQMVAVVD